MTAKVIGNRAASTAYKSGNGGIGVAGDFNGGIGWVSVTGSEAGDFAFITAASLSTFVDRGYVFQTTSSVTLEFTLQNSALATNPDPAVQSGVAWANSQTLAAADGLFARDFGFSVMKITFTEPGEFYAISR